MLQYTILFHDILYCAILYDLVLRELDGLDRESSLDPTSAKPNLMCCCYLVLLFLKY